MTRKNFITIAAALRLSKPALGDRKRPNSAAIEQGARMQWEHDCTSLADVLALSNPLFDRSRFLDACGYYKVPR